MESSQIPASGNLMLHAIWETLQKFLRQMKSCKEQSMTWLLDDCSELMSMENTHVSHCKPTKSTIDFGSVEKNSTHQCA